MKTSVGLSTQSLREAIDLSLLYSIETTLHDYDGGCEDDSRGLREQAAY